MSTNVTLPDLGEGIDTATVVEVFVKPGDTIASEQTVLSLETDKAQFELPAPTGGTVEAVLVQVGDDVAIGQPILRIAGEGGASAPQPEASKERAEPSAPPPAPTPAASVPAPSRPSGPAVAPPSVRRLAREHGVALDDVAARTGGDRVSAGDVVAFLRGAPAAAEPLPDFSRWGEIEIEPMSKIRRKTAENMARAWIEIPTVTHHDEADITSLDQLRRRYADRAKQAGGHLTWTAILLNVLAGALKRFPIFNASVDMAESRIVHKKYFHIGVAVDTERGLLVPVIRDVDRKNVIELARELTTLSDAARNRNIKPDAMQGATFTITNLGGVGGVAFSPIVNPPQVAILGVSRSATRPVWRDGGVVPRLILPLALSYDHRIIDGADAARFLRWVCEALEEPFLLDLEGQ